MGECSNGGTEIPKSKYIKISQPSLEEDKNISEMLEDEEKETTIDVEAAENNELLNNGTKSVIFRETTV